MQIGLILPLCISMGLLSWALIVRWYIHPVLSRYPFRHAVQPILLLHSFRYIGLMFLVPGVTAEVLNSRFADYAAYGDLIAAFLALIALAAIRAELRWGLVAVAVFNVWGLADLINAVVRGMLFNSDSALGATYWIPATIVPLLVVTHVYVIYLILREIGSSRVEQPVEA